MKHMNLFYEHVEKNSLLDLGIFRFTDDNIIEFATDFDWPAGEYDATLAIRDEVGRLKASDWHVAVAWMHQMVEFQKATRAKLKAAGEKFAKFGPSPGYKNLRWYLPVHSGEGIQYTSRIIDKKDLSKWPEWGILILENEGRNEADELVYSFLGSVFIEREKPLV